MSTSLIVVVDRSPVEARTSRQAIEFLELSEIKCATLNNWIQIVGESPLDAVLIGAGLTDDEVAGLVEDVEALDPRVPIVRLTRR